MRDRLLPQQRVLAIAEELARFLLSAMVNDAGEFSVNRCPPRSEIKKFEVVTFALYGYESVPNHVCMID